ncbi:DUF4145 domain-containing protein [Salisediminibacterium selenitireducens]|uniref:DUF4145 domain-containing protein n=1 Tax=Bacillus selenitireducens (strain ATCC 700615 / DSM 15326 / MLS10) TaxID=439292 RepID=D6XXW9_BACIE|nr:DUF4145 domain-containing protein [Salisediminibacterium selenitireducens]ADI00162.1 hypothetical protein Bsel_2662 [[Bacillus] selenitireducens MLS10]
MEKQAYYYEFLSYADTDLAKLAEELEKSVFTSPRVMLTNARTMVEGIVKRALRKEGISDIACENLLDRIRLLKSHGKCSEDVLNAIHEIRKAGNSAAHETKEFRYSQALRTWEELYVLVAWYMKKYGPLKFEMPAYREPEIPNENAYDPMELEVKFQQLEASLLAKFDNLNGLKETEAKNVEEPQRDQETRPQVSEHPPASVPGETPIRMIRYGDEEVAIPYFLRDAFLLPQRFPKSTSFLVKLGAVEEARIMSELPSDLAGLADRVSRYNAKNEKQFFDELKLFIGEEKVRRAVRLDKSGETILFFKTDYLIMTKNLSEILLTEEYFKGIPHFLKKMNEDGILSVGQLPSELLILAKYKGVGIGMVEKLFDQIKKLQEELKQSYNKEEEEEDRHVT